MKEDEIKAFRCTHCSGINRVKVVPDHRRPICGRCKEKLDVSGTPQDINTAEMKSIVQKAPIPVLVDIWAPWCGPCRVLAPVLSELAKANAGDVLVLKLNSDDNPEPSQQYQVRGIPTLLLFKNGKEASRQTGVPTPPQLKSWLQSNLS